MILAFIILCIAKPEKVNGFTILSLMVAIPYIMKFLGKNYFILKNEMISQIKNDKSFDFMQVKNIKNVKFSVFQNTIKNRDDFEDIINQNDGLSSQNFTFDYYFYIHICNFCI